MSYEELDRVGVIERVIEKRLTQREAARMLGLTSRQVRRLCRVSERRGLKLSVERLRHGMIEDGLQVPRARQEPPIQQPRHRRPRRGERVQIDGCDHEWFEERERTEARVAMASTTLPKGRLLRVGTPRRTTPNSPAEARP